MQLHSLLTAAGLAVTTTNAFLLPPEISEADNDIVNTLPVPTESDFNIPQIAEAQNVKLQCPGCPVRVGKDAQVNMNVPSHLELDFSVDVSDGPDRLMLNGFELYPNSDPFKNALTATLQPDIPHRQMKGPPRFKGPRPQDVQPLGFGMQTRPEAKSDEDSLELLVVELQIIEVGNAFVDGIPNVQVKLVKTPTGKLMIGDIETKSSMPKNPMDNQEECATMLCQWKAKLMQQLARLRPSQGCAGMRAHGKGKGKGKGQGQDGHGHGHPGQFKHKHSWGQLFKNIGAHILLPIAIGIMAGITASILGMMVGTFIVFLWRKLARPAGSRRHVRQGSCHKAAQNEVAVGDEKSGLMVNQEEIDAPPTYLEAGEVIIKDTKSDNEA